MVSKGDVREHGRSSDHDRREGSRFRQVRLGWCAGKMVRACLLPSVEKLNGGALNIVARCVVKYLPYFLSSSHPTLDNSLDLLLWGIKYIDWDQGDW